MILSPHAAHRTIWGDGPSAGQVRVAALDCPQLWTNVGMTFFGKQVSAPHGPMKVVVASEGCMHPGAVSL
jgi:hypothetical protein